MKDNQKPELLLTLARDCRLCCELLCNAICRECPSCVGNISDLNRHALFELSEAERRFLQGKEQDCDVLHAAHALVNCVTHAFSASMLLSLTTGTPVLPPLLEIAKSHTQLAVGIEQLLSHNPASIRPHSFHQYANKSRDANALLLTNYCSTESGRNLLPLALALASHLHHLEHACHILIEVLPRDTH